MRVTTIPKVDQEIDEDLQQGISGVWKVILYNDDWHTIDEVVFQVQKATGYCLERAEQITFEAHTAGRAIAYAGEKDDCRQVATVLREIRLQVEVDQG